MKKLNPKDLQRAREIAGLSQYQVSQKTGIDRARLSEIENSHVVAKPEELSAIHATLRTAHEKEAQEFTRLLENLQEFMRLAGFEAV